jgi:pimeloyl-ACP methyl ester carboxylesterase
MLTKAAAPGLIAVKVPSSPGARPVPVVAGGPAIGWVTGSESGEEARVPYVGIGEAKIWYTEQGTGFPMLTLAPGGMSSSVPLWEMAAINPLTAYAGQYQMIAMDQRNAGQSAGPLEAGDPWGAYAADQLAVMDHLGIDRFLVFGCCIGGPFILKLLALAPERDHHGQPGAL